MSSVSFQDTRSIYKNCFSVLAMKIQKLKIPNSIVYNTKKHENSGNKSNKRYERLTHKTMNNGERN